MSQWPNLCDTIRSFNTFVSSITNLSSIQWSPYFNNLWGRQNSLCWQCMVYYRNLWNSWNGNKWPLYVHMTEVTMHGRPDVTLVESAAHYVSRSVLSFPMKNLCGIHTSATIQLVLMFHWVDSYDESKSFKIIFPCRSVRSSINLFIGRTLGNSFPLANLPSIGSACHQSVPHCVSNFNYRVWRDFRTSQHISGMEYIIRSKTLCLFSVLFIVESYNTVFVHHVPFLLSVRWYDHGEHCLIISPSAFQLFLNRCNNHKW